MFEINLCCPHCGCYIFFADEQDHIVCSECETVLALETLTAREFSTDRP